MRRPPGTGEQLPHARSTAPATVPAPSHEDLEGFGNSVLTSAAAVLAALPDPVVVLNRRGRITGWNPAAEELFGWSGSEVEGRMWTEFVVPEGGTAPVTHAEAIGTAMQRGGTWEGSFPITTRAGDSLLARVRAAPITSHGVFAGTVVTAIDLFGADASRDDQARAAQRAAVRAAVLSRAGMQLGTSLDTGRTLAALAEILVPAFADSCIVDLLDENGTAQRLVTVHSNDNTPCPPMRAGTEIHYPARHPCEKTLRTGRPVVIQGTPRIKAPHPESECDQKSLLLDAKSLIAVPLLAPSGVRGVLAIAYTEDTDPARHYDAADLELIEELAARAGLALENAAIFDRQRTLALALQKSLLPTDLPLPDGVSIRVGYAPGADSEVSGDLYDVVELSSGRIGVVIGDVQGRGAHAAAVMGQLRAALRAYVVLDVQPGQLLSYLDEVVRSLNEEILVTCVYAIYDPFTRRCALANAGHPPPLLASAHGCHPMEVPPDVPLGIGPLGPGSGKGPMQFTDHIFNVPPGDVLIMYTDGVVERRDQSVDQGVRTLCAAIESVVREPRAICRAALRAAGSEAHDDQAVLAMATSTVDLPLSRLALPARPEAAFAARHHTRAVLREWGLSEHAELAELLVSELITNAVRHASGPRPSPWSFADDSYPEANNGPRSLDALEKAATREYSDHLGAMDEDNEMDLLAEPGMLDELGLLDGTLSAPGGSRRLDLVLRRGLRALWIEVHDPDVRLPRIRQAGETDEGGRGLYLVDALSARWGARPTDAGKFVWFELPLY